MKFNSLLFSAVFLLIFSKAKAERDPRPVVYNDCHSKIAEVIVSYATEANLRRSLLDEDYFWILTNITRAEGQSRGDGFSCSYTEKDGQEVATVAGQLLSEENVPMRVRSFFARNNDIFFAIVEAGP